MLMSSVFLPGALCVVLALIRINDDFGIYRWEEAGDEISRG